ncbi:MAG: hypothetical protein IT326_07175 [Anaerolineae bacterium]|nr:hypothetical protein [Anaerolineae bacterium]
MTLDLKLVLKAGVIWGVVAIILIVVLQFVPGASGLGLEGVTLATFATIFAGVHFSARSGTNNILVGLIGGMLAGILAALLLIAAAFLLPMIGGAAANVGTIVSALIAGVVGAVGMEIIKRV